MQVPSPEVEQYTEGLERLYSIFCMAKHGNPRMLRRYGVKLDEDRITVYRGPFISAATTWQSRFTLYHSTRLLMAAVGVLLRPHLDSLSSRELTRVIRQMASLADELECLGQQLRLQIPKPPTDTP